MSETKKVNQGQMQQGQHAYCNSQKNAGFIGARP